jgi:hypothetical protein
MLARERSEVQDSSLRCFMLADRCGAGLGGLTTRLMITGVTSGRQANMRRLRHTGGDMIHSCNTIAKAASQIHVRVERTACYFGLPGFGRQLLERHYMASWQPVAHLRPVWLLRCRANGFA